MPEAPIKQVAAGIAIMSGMVLVTRRAHGQNLAGLWEFPGGKLEAGETPQTCIVRELHEELGVGTTAGEVLVEAIHRYPGGAINLIAVQVVLDHQDLQLSVHDAYAWVAPRELLTIGLAPADVPIAEEIIRRHS